MCDMKLSDFVAGDCPTVNLTDPKWRPPLVSLLWNVTLARAKRSGYRVRLVNARWAYTHAGACFDRGIQPWRRWIGGVEHYDAFRDDLLRACGLPERLPRAAKVVVVNRRGKMRRWGSLDAGVEALRPVCSAHGLSLVVVTPGALTPCHAKQHHPRPRFHETPPKNFSVKKL